MPSRITRFFVKQKYHCFNYLLPDYLHTVITRYVELRKTIAYEQLEWRLRESKIPSTKIEEQFSRHCVRNLLVHDPKLVSFPDERTVDRGSNESGRVWNILWQRESTLSRFIYQKVWCRRPLGQWLFWIEKLEDLHHYMDHFSSGLYSGSYGR
ncbi:conserved hypothetical protein [Trichinella spiralis]|uniref:hypothetical protein n=1 Tax=Trichinella spiralis TaxID=6334 RepID=UPI0001EFF04A|nr:conserved hypothetical protein [Trichinella spiralis]